MVVSCQICGFETSSHLQSHLIHKHGITPTEYKEKFPGDDWCSKEFASKMTKIRRDNSKTEKALKAKSLVGKSNKGKRRSKEWRRHRSKQYSGKRNPFYGKNHSIDTKIKLSCHFRDIKIEDFDGFTKSLSLRQTKSGAFKTWRRLVFERDNYTCLLCGNRGGFLEPHHIIPRRDAADRIYEIDNGATLCKNCHKKTFRKEYEFVEVLTGKVGRRVMS